MDTGVSLVVSWGRFGVGEQLVIGGECCGVILGEIGLSTLLLRAEKLWVATKLENELRKLGEDVPPASALLLGTNSGACGVT